MLLDSFNEFADAVAVTGAAGTNIIGDVIDLASVKDLGEGTPMWLVIQVSTLELPLEGGAPGEEVARKGSPSGKSSEEKKEKELDQPPPEPGPPLLRGRVLGEGQGIAGASPALSGVHHREPAAVSVRRSSALGLVFKARQTRRIDFMLGLRTPRSIPLM